MKRSLILSLLGLATACGTAHGQGGIVIANYQAPYNPVLWTPLPSGGQVPVLSTDGVNLSLWYGEGVLTQEQLTGSIPLTWNTEEEQAGYPGFYYSGVVMLPDWDSGDTYTFQVRADGNTPYGVVAARSALWQENENIWYIGGNPPGFPGMSTHSIGIPEPSTFALVVGAIGLAFARPRR